MRRNAECLDAKGLQPKNRCPGGSRLGIPTDDFLAEKAARR